LDTYLESKGSFAVTSCIHHTNYELKPHHILVHYNEPLNYSSAIFYHLQIPALSNHELPFHLVEDDIA